MSPVFPHMSIARVDGQRRLSNPGEVERALARRRHHRDGRVLATNQQVGEHSLALPIIARGISPEVATT